VHHQGLAGFAGGLDMDTEALALPFGVARLPVVIQAGFANGDDLGMAASCTSRSTVGSSPPCSSGWTPTVACSCG
jgi:hypothetical protein